MSTKVKRELLETGETLYCCPQCPFKADKMQTTKVHMLRHTGQFSCQKCKKSCRSQKDLKSHMKNVHKEKPTVDEQEQQQQLVQVKMEGNEVTASRDKSRLGRRQKKESSKGQFRCQYCEYTTDRQILLNQHCKYHINSSVIKHLCPDPACFKPFPSPYHVKRHIRYNHPDAKYSLIKLEPKKTVVAKTTNETTTPVKVTKEKAPSSKKKRKLKKGAKVGNAPNNVETPSVVTKSSETKETKKKDPTPAPVPPSPDVFQCAHCKYSTNQKNHLRQHMTYHSSKYLCQTCDKSFPCAKRLQMHIERVHDEIEKEEEKDTMEEEEAEAARKKNEPITSLWGFDLSDFGIDAIVLNDQVEETLPPTSPMSNILPTYSSNVFPNDFNVQTTAPSDAENPFSCPFCPYRGKKKRNLDSHMVYHTDKFKCETCSKRHPTLYHLNRHIRLVHCGNPDENFPKQDRDDDQQSSPSLYFPLDSSVIKEESESSLPFNLTELMAVEATEDLNGTIKLEADPDCESPGDCDDTGLQTSAAMETETLSALDDIQFNLPNEIQFSVQTDGQKLFFCSDCPYQNPKKQNVKQHRKIHTQQYACSSCGKGHTTSYHLKRHLNHGSCCNNGAKSDGEGVKVEKKRAKKANGQA